MAPSYTVEIEDVTTISPPLMDNLPPSFSLPQTYFDSFWLKFPPVERVYFYKLTESTPDYFYTVILPRLKLSLSHTLLHFLPLAGRVVWPTTSPAPTILYTENDSVTLTVAVSDADLDHLSGNEPRKAADSHPYVPELSNSETEVSVIAIQITLFPCKGFSIGYTMNHCVLDGKSITMFMKSWAHICKQMENEKHPENNNYSLPEKLVPCFDRSVVKDTLGLQESYVKQWASLSGQKSIKNWRSLKLWPQLAIEDDKVKATFELSRQNLMSLKKKCQSIDPSIRLSSFVVTSAYVLVCMVKARGGDVNRKVAMLFSVDCRARLNPPLPANYFGNCISCAWFYDAIANDFIEQDGFANAARKIGRVVTDLDKNLFKGAKDLLTDTMRLMNEGVQLISIAGSPRFNVYRTDFGWGKPEKSEVTSIDRTGAFALNEGKDGNGGVQIGLALTKSEMDVFRCLFLNGLREF